MIGYYNYNVNEGITCFGKFYYDNKDQMITATINDATYNITYSQTGQPNSYLGWNISYDMRNISVITNNDYQVEYRYNASGIRTQKIITHNSATETIDYLLDGNNIIRETHTGANNYTINYYYDSNNEIIGFTYNNNKYLYLKNLQNDIIGIVDQNNNIVVKYYYDAYGRIIKLEDTSSINLSTINPFRYRSYYQDSETNWYYLNSRYYNAVINRFITMDSIEYLGANGSLLSYNLYSYCENNPVNMVDYNGTDAIYVVDYGLPILGHAFLYYESGGVWYKTEFNGSKNDKRTARVYNKVSIKKSANIIINSLPKKQKYIYIKGDFSGVFDEIVDEYGLVLKDESTGRYDNYPQYNLFTNNCLHYVLKFLNYGYISDPLLNKFINNTKLIIPSVFYNTALNHISRSYTPNINTLSSPSLFRRVI